MYLCLLDTEGSSLSDTQISSRCSAPELSEPWPAASGLMLADDGRCEACLWRMQFLLSSDVGIFKLGLSGRLQLSVGAASHAGNSGPASQHEVTLCCSCNIAAQSLTIESDHHLNQHLELGFLGTVCPPATVKHCRSGSESCRFLHGAIDHNKGVRGKGSRPSLP